MSEQLPPIARLVYPWQKRPLGPSTHLRRMMTVQPPQRSDFDLKECTIVQHVVPLHINYTI